MLAVPDSFDDITLEWFSNALREGNVLDAVVSSITVDPLDPGKGLIGDLARVHVTYSSGEGPASFIVKVPAANPDSRRIGTMLNAYAREVAFYRHVAPQSVGTRLPTCFYAGEDRDRERWALILQDCPADPFDFSAGASEGQAEAAIDALADFHSVWWQAENAFDWMPGFDTTGVGGLQPLWLDSLPHFVDRYAHVLPEPTREWVLDFAPRLRDWSDSAASEPLTMVHSDYRIDNLIFGSEGVTIIDWQTTMRAPAAMDVSCFIATSLGSEHRAKTEADLIERYIKRVETAGHTIERDWFLRSYDENLLWWMGQFGNNLAHLDPGDEQVQAALDTMVARVYSAGLDRNVGRLLD